MFKKISSTQKAYLAGFLDGDGSIFVRLKSNLTYKYGFQVAPYVVLFQSQKEETNFRKICSLIDFGQIRKRNDGMLEYVVNKQDAIFEFLKIVEPFVILKKKQVLLMFKILDKKKFVKSQEEFNELAELIDKFRELNYSKKRKKHKLTP